ncbi:Serine/threonine-protein kinase-like protein [Emericellopsis cladophorae]|uniref:Serine/threonine-protein kinase-like protein n=1 Tax=Emericellopsis cladophorae TaxID=2686198 RepID=A0A9Q0B8A6_9HYPO|nr:Serine/threonine-protein kinase-like protein [Emericellopsis cladophorae]KAI6777872.1 Serine/threonine-protein kinase-like protein [Emericellopsis cladophorae]
MQVARGKTVSNGRKAKLANSYQELLDEFSNKELKSVGNYNLGRLIGKGSFGKVYLASHKLINGSKVVLKSANKDDSNLAREIHHHRQFVHPHIARLYEVIVTESLVWLALEYCPGDELYNYLLKYGPLPIAKVQKIFAQLVGAVAYVHQQSCVHRDLKLENILFDKNENVKLVDFGFTREYEGRTNQLQTFCGTICYAAPEMLKGEKYAGEKVDVWSLGIILYALLCGELPFDDDDDGATRTKILTEKPAFPEHLPADAVSLMEALLSKRPFPRPSLPDILSHPFLAEHAPAQQAILEVHQPSPFTTGLEKDCLHRMKSAGVDIDMVIESVLAQKCDALSGWWTLLLAKERRKLARRERKRTEREAESKSSRRVSAASSRLERMAPSLHDVDEDGGLTSHFISSRSRGRSSRRSTHYYTDFNFQELATQFGDPSAWNGLGSPDEIPPTPVDKDSIRSASTSTHRRPVPPPKEGIIRSARSRGSTLHLVTTPEALGQSGHHHHDSHTTAETNGNAKSRPSEAPVSVPSAVDAHARDPAIFDNETVIGRSARPQVHVVVSLVMSVSKSAHHRGASPQHSVKLLPATPTAQSFPSNIRLVRAAPAPLNFYNEGMPHNESAVPGSPNPFSSGVLFARRKKNIFKGPSLNPGGVSGSGHRSSAAGGHSRSASGSAIARRSGEVTIQEEDEDHEAEVEVVEEVENFTPVITRPGEIVEERIIEADEEPEVRDDANAAAIKTP